MDMPGFEEFRTQYAGRRIDGPPMDKALMDKYRDRLPKALLEEWGISGFAGFDDGFIWLTNPDDMAPVLAEWRIEFDGLTFARTGFGDLFLWDGTSVQCLAVHDGRVDWLTDDLPLFFDFSLCDEPFLEEVLRYKLFFEARPKLGPVASDEMYTFVPALVLGGDEDADHLKKVKLREQLLFLSQAHASSRGRQ